MKEDIFHLGIKALIRNQEGKILLLKVNTKNLQGHKGFAYWDIPGGRIHKGSTVEDTLRREVVEETGIGNIQDIKAFTMVLSPIRIPLKDGSNVGLILSIYTCQADEIGEVKLSDENSDYKWVDTKKAGELLSFKYPSEFTNRLVKL